MRQPNVSLSAEDALVLQRINETGEEDLISLEQMLGMKRGRVIASLENLRKKGLITIQRTASDWWVHVSSKGKALASYVWPEMSPVGAL